MLPKRTTRLGSYFFAMLIGLHVSRVSRGRFLARSIYNSYLLYNAFIYYLLHSHNPSQKILDLF